MLNEIQTTTLRNRDMPIVKPKTKAGKQAVVKTEMHAFKKGELHSGAKDGPVVHNPKQAIAISLSEAGESRKPKGDGHEAREKEVLGAGYAAHEKAEKASYGSGVEVAPARTPHAFDRPSAKPAQGYGHDATQRRGALRLSGHSGAHHIGKR